MSNEKPASPTGFDISSFDVVSRSEEGIEFEIKNPVTEEGTGLYLRIMGGFADRFQELMAKAKKREELKKHSQASNASDSGQEGEMPDVLAKVTLGWRTVFSDGSERPVAIFNGEELTFSTANAKTVYGNPIVRGQTVAQALNIANFIKS